MAKPIKYTVTDGKLVLVLEVCEEGGYCVTAPFVPGLITQADSLEEAFMMARDAESLLKECAREDLREERISSSAKSNRRLSNRGHGRRSRPDNG